MAAEIQLRPMARSGGRQSRKEAIARSRSGPLLMLCLEARTSPQLSEKPTLKLEVAVIASKKLVSKLAVERNRLKRRLRHAAQVLKDDMSCRAFEPREDVYLKLILVGHRDMENTPFAELQQQITAAFRKLLDQLLKSKKV